MKNIELKSIESDKNVFLHFTSTDALKSIEQEGLKPLIGANSYRLEKTPKVFFVQGFEHLLEIVDVWLKWEYNNKMKALFRDTKDPIKKDYYNYMFNRGYDFFMDMQVLSATYKKVFQDFRNRTILVLNLKENEDFSFDDIDEVKVRNRRLRVNIKFVYGRHNPNFSDEKYTVMDRWNMHTFTNKGVEPHKILGAVVTEDKKDALSVILQTYADFKKYLKETKQDSPFILLEDFTNRCKIALEQEDEASDLFEITK